MAESPASQLAHKRWDGKSKKQKQEGTEAARTASHARTTDEYAEAARKGWAKRRKKKK